METQDVAKRAEEMEGTTTVTNVEGDEFSIYRQRVRSYGYDILSGDSGRFVFSTTAREEIWDTYLDSFEMGFRQNHNCRACQDFLIRYGHLAYIREDGRLASVFWNEKNAPALYKEAARRMRRLVERARVTDVFLTDNPEWGLWRTGEWTHFAITPPEKSLFKDNTLSVRAAIARRHEWFDNVTTALDEMPLKIFRQLCGLLDSGVMFRDEKIKFQVEWLTDLSATRNELRGPARDNVVWRAIAGAPEGFCHPRASIAWTVLKDLQSGKTVESIRAAFQEKMREYQRPKAMPSVGNIDAAEKLIRELGVEASLQRRFARLEDVQEFVWRPKVEESSGSRDSENGVFSHLRPKEEKAGAVIDIPMQKITWKKFADKVLPKATSIEIMLREMPMRFGALSTVVDPEADPILQWDLPERRNPVDWFLDKHGNYPRGYSLSPGWHKLSGIAFIPTMWADAEGKFEHHGKGVVFIVDGARPVSEYAMGIFPESLQSRFHSIRSTIEAFSQQGQLQGREEASACGIFSFDGGYWDVELRVRTENSQNLFLLDRWD